MEAGKQDEEAQLFLARFVARKKLLVWGDRLTGDIVDERDSATARGIVGRVLVFPGSCRFQLRRGQALGSASTRMLALSIEALCLLTLPPVSMGCEGLAQLVWWSVLGKPSE